MKCVESGTICLVFFVWPFLCYLNWMEFTQFFFEVKDLRAPITISMKMPLLKIKKKHKTKQILFNVKTKTK